MYITEETGSSANPEAAVLGAVQGSDPVETAPCFEPMFTIKPPNAFRGGGPNRFIGEFGECYRLRRRGFFFRRKSFCLLLSHQNSAALCAQPEVAVSGGE